MKNLGYGGLVFKNEIQFITVQLRDVPLVCLSLGRLSSSRYVALGGLALLGRLSVYPINKSSVPQRFMFSFEKEQSGRSKISNDVIRLWMVIIILFLVFVNLSIVVMTTYIVCRHHLEFSQSQYNLKVWLQSTVYCHKARLSLSCDWRL